MELSSLSEIETADDLKTQNAFYLMHIWKRKDSISMISITKIINGIKTRFIYFSFHILVNKFRHLLALHRDQLIVLNVQLLLHKFRQFYSAYKFYLSRNSLINSWRLFLLDIHGQPIDFAHTQNTSDILHCAASFSTNHLQFQVIIRSKFRNRLEVSTRISLLLLVFDFVYVFLSSDKCHTIRWR